MDPLYGLAHLTSFLVGACLGSFLALSILRIPEGESVISPPSRCATCHTPIRWHDNVPILSWIVLRGRCRSCGASFSPFYPLIELTMGILTWLLFRRFVPPHAVDAAHLAAFGVYVAFAWLLLLAAYTDLRARIIPEVSSVYAVPLGVLGGGLLDALGYDGWMDVGWRGAVLGAALGGGFLGLVSFAWHRIFGSEGVAWGDVRLMAMIGAFVGALPGTWMVLLLSSFLGAGFGLLKILVTRRSGYLPFGPALAVAALVYVLWGDVLVVRWLPGMAQFL